MILVDTCVLIDVSADDPEWRGWSIAQLAAWSVRGPLFTNPLIFAEWCTDFASLEAAQSALAAFGLQWAELPQAALYLAAQAHLRYRRRGGTRSMVLPDFLIGAHAAVQGWPVLTRDRHRFDAYFSGLEIVAPR
ncbi:MAG: type II toxin-antitoxin system VapC family toxin [Burkholderiales bacterium]|nr:type II toxin-antitoxin system VapC family toxin [Burkholderiales bacterium]